MNSFSKALAATAMWAMATSGYAAWDFRGDPNQWGTTRMTDVGDGRHFVRQTFGAGESRFKVARDDGWAVSFPAQNVTVAPGKTFDILFSESTKAVTADEVTGAENWVVRGTANAFGKTPMVRTGSVFTLCQDFGAADPRFKVSHGTKADWAENYPAADVRVPVNSSVDITFNPATRGIQTQVRSARCGGNPPVAIDVHRSLVVHDVATLNETGLDITTVMNRLAAQFNATGTAASVTGELLFQRFWDTQNPPPGLVSGGPKCEGTLNGFPLECRPVEGEQAGRPEALANYRLLALVNRFDLRDPQNFADCGEHRIVYGLPFSRGIRRSFVILEAQLPNPVPGSPSGCRAVAEFWRNLSADDNAATRGAALRNFYLNGLGGTTGRPVVDIRNYAAGTGQVRANLFLGDSWVLKEFKAAQADGLSFFRPVSVKANPFGELFNAQRTDAAAVAFRSQFLANMRTLLIPDLSTFSLTVQDDAHNNGQSHANGPTTENQYLEHTRLGGEAFSRAIEARARELGSQLTADQVVNRATAMTCGGCHMPSSFGLRNPNSVGPNQVWPETGTFVHVSNFEAGGSFQLSAAMTDVFLPARKTDLETFLATASHARTTVPAGVKVKPVRTGKRSG